ncbi:hypothetical protein FISHEDRAFT_56023 [Fistulina hepatica ATCC 64428]|uniref:DUF6532 domain-containing protein n=1 Tax=Fistulina hepatica ATCC 64428 TaxID=1128425 RepID=A0A0D7AK91_9AGAR|nr:hypothetical protein FISHEDRAFT_56023 [Fistulina hepatica ATCC 64428]
MRMLNTTSTRSSPLIDVDGRQWLNSPRLHAYAVGIPRPHCNCFTHAVTATRKAAAGARNFVTGRKKHEERVEQRQCKDMLQEQAQHSGPPHPPQGAFSEESSNDEGPVQPVPKTVSRKMVEGVPAAKATKVPVKGTSASKSGPATKRTAIDQFDDDNGEVSSDDGADVTSQEDDDAVDEDEDLDKLDDAAIQATFNAERVVATGADESDEDNVSNDDDLERRASTDSTMSLASDAPPPTSDSDGAALEYDSQEDKEDVHTSADVKHMKKRSHRQVTDDDLDAEFDDLLPPEPVHVVKKKCSQHREEAIKAEVPQWVNKTPTSSEDTMVKGRKLVRDSYEQTLPAHICLTNPQGTVGISKKGQSIEMNALTDYTIDQIEADIVFENAFPEHTNKIIYQHNALISALNTNGFLIDEEKCKDIEKHLITDVAFVQVLGNLVWGCVPQFRLALRSRGAQAPAHYQLGVGQNCKECVSSLLTDNWYIHDGKWKDNEWVLSSKDHPYDCTAIRDVLSLFFMSKKLLGRNPRYADRFTGPETNEECCHEDLLPFTGSFYAAIYNSHVMTLKTLCNQNSVWYHRLVSSLYDKLVCSSQKNVAMQATPSDMLASIKIPEA